jgi:hypothetical protein
LFFSGDANTGIYSPGADQVAVATNGTGRITIDGSGNVGIGITPVANTLIGGARGSSLPGLIELAGNGNTVGSSGFAIGQDGSGVATLFQRANAAMYFATNGSERLRITSTGALNFVGAGSAGSTQAVSFNGSAPVNSLVIDSSGRVGIGTSSPNGKLDVADGDAYITKNSGGDSAGVTSQSLYIRTQSGNLARLYSISSGSGGPNGFGGDLYIQTKNDNGALADRVTITRTGLVGIGTMSPGALLHLAGNNTTSTSDTPVATIRLEDTDVSTAAEQPIGKIEFYGNDITVPSVGPQAYILSKAAGTSGGGDLRFGTCTNSAATESARIDSSGRLLVGTPSSLRSSALIQSKASSGTHETWHQSDSLANEEFCRGIYVSGSRSGQVGVFKHSAITNPAGFLYLQREDSSDAWYWTDNSGNLRISNTTSNIGTTGGTVVGTQTSDERLKNILGPVEYGLDTLKQIEPVRYTLKSEPDTEKLGFIAQQVLPLVPQSVFDTGEEIEEGEPTKLGMEYVALIPVLVNAIKELSAEVDALKAQLS